MRTAGSSLRAASSNSCTNAAASSRRRRRGLGAREVGEAKQLLELVDQDEWRDVIRRRRSRVGVQQAERGLRKRKSKPFPARRRGPRVRRVGVLGGPARQRFGQARNRRIARPHLPPAPVRPPSPASPRRAGAEAPRGPPTTCRCPSCRRRRPAVRDRGGGTGRSSARRDQRTRHGPRTHRGAGRGMAIGEAGRVTIPPQQRAQQRIERLGGHLECRSRRSRRRDRSWGKLAQAFFRRPRGGKASTLRQVNAFARPISCHRAARSPSPGPKRPPPRPSTTAQRRGLQSVAVHPLPFRGTTLEGR